MFKSVVAKLHPRIHVNLSQMLIKEIAEEYMGLNIPGSKSYPSLSNLPNTISKSEDISVGETLYTVSVSDDDLPEETHIIEMSVSPASGMSYFQLDPSSACHMCSIVVFFYCFNNMKLGTTPKN